MKTFLFANSFSTLRRRLFTALLLLAAPLMLSAQHPGDNPPSNQDPMFDSINSRLERRMAAVQERLKTMQEYLAQTQPDDEFFTAPPDIPNMFDEDFFDNFEHMVPDIEDLRSRLDSVPPMPDFDFDFNGPFPQNGNGAWEYICQGKPGHNGIYIYIEQPDSTGSKPYKKVKKVMILHGGNDTLVMEGDHNLIYSISDDNGHFTVKSHGPNGDTLISDTSGALYYAWGSDEKPRHRFSWKKAGKDKDWFSPDDNAFRYNYQFKNNDFGSVPLSDLSSDDISRLKRTELKPARKTVPLGIDNLTVNILRENNQLRLRFSTPGDEDISVQLFDENGAMFHDEYLRKNSGRYDNRITLPDNGSNTIFLRITRGKQSMVKKLDM